jgi:hypothetical protein
MQVVYTVTVTVPDKPVEIGDFYPVVRAGELATPQDMAQIVMTERLDPEDDYAYTFAYTIAYELAETPPQGIPSTE